MTDATIINAGNGGFHVLTFVTDGYGNLVAEDMFGNHLGMTKFPTPALNDIVDNPALAEAMRKLAIEAFETMEAHQRAGISLAQVQLDRRADHAKVRAAVAAKLTAELDARRAGLPGGPANQTPTGRTRMLNADRDKLIEAVKYVIADQRQGYTLEDEPDDFKLIGYARNSLWVHVDGEPDGPANWEVSLDEGTEESYNAYKAVLLATQQQLDYVFLSMV